MGSCGKVEKRLNELATLRETEVPAEIQEHLSGCAACARALAAARLRRGLLAVAADAPEPPAGFADRVLARLPERKLPQAETELWRSGWGLVPAFAATVLLLVILDQFQGSTAPGPVGFLSMEGMSTGESIVLENTPLEPDEILTAIMEGGET
jgi:hypothetical protein